MNIPRILTIISLFIATIGVCGAVVSIPAGTVSSYSLATAGETYQLEGDVTATGTAFIVNAADVTFDGMGHKITFGTTSTGYAFSNTNKHNFILRNTTVEQTNTAVNNCYAIYIYGGNNAWIEDVDSYSSKSYALYFRNSVGSVCTGSELTSGSGTAAYLNGGSYNTLNYSTIASTSGYGIIVDNSPYVTIEGNTISSGTSIGVSLPATTTFATVSGNDISTTTNVALRLLNTANHTITDNTLTATTSNGLYLGGATGVSGCTIMDNTIESNSGIAAYLINSTYNNVRRNICTSNTANGMFVRSSSYNTINDNECTSGSDNGLMVAYGSHYNDLDGNHGISTSKKGIFLFNVTGNTFKDTLVTSPYCSYPVTRSVGMFGDSITEGGQAGTEYGQLGEMIESNLTARDTLTWVVQNRGFSGERAYQGLERFSQEMDIFNPDIAFIMYGTNDLLDSRPQQDIIDDILTMAAEADSRGSRVYVLLTPAIYTGNAARISLDQALMTQATAAGYGVINVYDAIDATPGNDVFDAYNDTNYEDGIHPNTIGNSMITQYIMDFELDDVNPPAQVTALGETARGTSFVTWSWTNPTSDDFSHVSLYLNGAFVTNTTGTTYNATNLTSASTYILGVRTVDDFGNVGTLRTDSASTTLIFNDEREQQDAENNAEIVTLLYAAVGFMSLIVLGLASFLVMEAWHGNVSTTAIGLVAKVVMVVCVLLLILYSAASVL